MRRYLVFGGVILALFLAVYSWNRRTGILDRAAVNVGLELSSWALGPWRSAQDVFLDIWNRYIDLVDVRDENLRLKARIDKLEALLVSRGEDFAELKRLRNLVRFPVDARWRTLAARVLAGRMGPNSALDSITISRGYANGARPGMPLVTNLGLVGRVLRSSPHASTALLLTDPASKVAVFGQESRSSGILKGQGTDKPLEVEFVRRNTGMKDGEILVTSGLDEKYPKGLPVGRVTSVAPSDYTQFMRVTAVPLVDFQHLEEVLLLEKSGLPENEIPYRYNADEFVGPVLPPGFQKDGQKNPSVPTAANPPNIQITNGTDSADILSGTGERKIFPDSVPARNNPEENPQKTRPIPEGDNLTQSGNIPKNREGAPMYRIITP